MAKVQQTPPRMAENNFMAKAASSDIPTASAAVAATSSPSFSPSSTSLHGNWVTTPLIPRKSPERGSNKSGLARVRQGHHKATQSLDLAKFKALEVERLAIARSPLASSAADSSIRENIPRFGILEVARKHESEKLDKNEEAESPSVAPVQAESYERIQVAKADQSPASLLLARRGHTRAAQSMSPTRHEVLTHALQKVPSPASSRSVSPRRKPVDYSGGDDEADTAVAKLKILSLEIPPPSRSAAASPTFDTTPLTPKRQASPLQEPTLAPEQVLVPVSSPKHRRSESQALLNFAADNKDTASNVARLHKSRCSVLDAEDDHETQLEWAAEALRLVHQRQRRQRQLDAAQRQTMATESRPLPSSKHAGDADLQQDALDIVVRLVHLNNARALYISGTLNEFGVNGYTHNGSEAIRCYKTAAALGYARAHYRLGLNYERAGDLTRARTCFERGAAHDDAACLCKLATMMLSREAGFLRDVDKALACIHLAALAADHEAPQGAYLFGLLLAGETRFDVNESELPRDLDGAVAFLARAAQLGHAGAQTRLGKAYEEAELDLPLDALLSLEMYGLAAEQGDEHADLAVSKWLLAGSDDGSVAKDEHGALVHAELAALRHLPSAQFALGYFAEVGIACEQSTHLAHRWYALAAKNGSSEANERLEGLSRSLTLTRKEHEEHIESKIHERRRTLRMSARAAGRIRHRAQMSISGFAQAQGNPYKVVGTLDSIDEARPLPVPQTLLREHRRNRSEFQHPAARPRSDSAADRERDRARADTLARLMEGSPPGREADAVDGKKELRLPMTDMSRVHIWSGEADVDATADSMSGLLSPQQLSPRVAPSDIATLRGKNSPRPESSVSNILPYRLDTASQAWQVQPRHRAPLQSPHHLHTHMQQQQQQLMPSAIFDLSSSVYSSDGGGGRRQPSPSRHGHGRGSSAYAFHGHARMQTSYEIASVVEDDHRSRPSTSATTLTNCPTSSSSSTTSYTELHDPPISAPHTPHTLSVTSSQPAKKQALTFEEMGIPIASKKESECTIM
ncbi:hypothetical protein PYCC9005_003878 [Savitreella phatthalungensis]